MLKIGSKYFKVKEPKKFAYTPRYYNERNERLQKQIAQYADSASEEDRLIREERLRNAFATNRRFSALQSRTEVRGRMLRMMIILVCLLAGVILAIRKSGLSDQLL
jgi:hypothetical protein